MSVSRSVPSTGSPSASRSASTALPSAPVPGRTSVSLSGIRAGAVEDDQPLDGREAVAGRAYGGQGLAEQGLAVAFEQGPGRVGAGQHRPGGAGGVGGVDGGVEARTVEPVGPGQHQRGLAPRRQGLVRAGHHRVRPERQRVSGQVRMEAEVGRPGGVDDQRYVVGVGHLGEGGDVADRAGVRRVADEHGPGPGVPRESLGHRRGRDAEGQPGGRVDVGAHPHGSEPGQHQSEEHRPVQRPADHDLVAVAAERQRDRLVRVRRAADREPAEVRAPQPCGPRLGVGQHAVGSASWCPGRRTAARRRRPRPRRGRGAACDRGW